MVYPVPAPKPPISSGSYRDRCDSQYARCCFDRVPILTGSKILCFVSVALDLIIASWLAYNYTWLWSLLLPFALITPVMTAIGIQRENYLAIAIPLILDSIEIFFGMLFLLVTFILGIADYDQRHLRHYNITSSEWHSIDYGWLIIFIYWIFVSWRASTFYSCYKYLKNPPYLLPTEYA